MNGFVAHATNVLVRDVLPRGSVDASMVVVVLAEPAGWTEPSRASQKLAAVQVLGLDSVKISCGPSSTRGELRLARGEPKARHPMSSLTCAYYYTHMHVLP